MILDTNAVFAFAENDSDLLKILPSDRPWYLPVVVVGEFKFGILGSSLEKELSQWLDDLISVVPVLDVTPTTAAHYAEIRHQLKQDKFRIPPNDSWIAAIAKEHRFSVLSRDSDFDKISGIERISW